jgi:thymidylate synthase
MERWDEVYRRLLREVLSEGESVGVGGSASVGSGRESTELLNYRFVLANPRDRILWSSTRNFNLYLAIARFVWMLSGSDRLKDIEYYEPRAAGFSDDTLTVPGSNYGTRLFMPEPGLDQIKEVVRRIESEPGTRRAAAVIYRPEDASRASRDIPCAFGMAFHPRSGQLHMTMIMRSNAAWGLLPYNVFEFTLLGEVVSVVADVPLGRYEVLSRSV